MSKKINPITGKKTNYLFRKVPVFNRKFKLDKLKYKTSVKLLNNNRIYMKREIISNKNFNKIFCIGFNKTGTTTLEKILQHYGYILPNQQEQEARITSRAFSGDYTEFKNFINHYDAFQDMPFSQGEIYIAADALFPNSKFILTVRDSEEWFNSVVRFYGKLFSVDLTKKTGEEELKKQFYLYDGYHYQNILRILTVFDGNKKIIKWDKLYDKEYFIKEYEDRNNRIKKYFQNCNDKLLAIDITKEKNTKKICDFLNIPEKYVIDMLHENKS